mmetsp:Transcript_14078/g.37883  ORF Transcript_14078/g.37883 Transcript_14078/m.37883 type:complete len:327 (+) Transcript_14078:643-1623(+)
MAGDKTRCSARVPGYYLPWTSRRAPCVEDKRRTKRCGASSRALFVGVVVLAGTYPAHNKHTMWCCAGQSKAVAEALRRGYSAWHASVRSEVFHGWTHNVFIQRGPMAEVHLEASRTASEAASEHLGETRGLSCGHSRSHVAQLVRRVRAVRAGVSRLRVRHGLGPPLARELRVHLPHITQGHRETHDTHWFEKAWARSEDGRGEGARGRGDDLPRPATGRHGVDESISDVDAHAAEALAGERSLRADLSKGIGEQVLDQVHALHPHGAIHESVGRSPLGTQAEDARGVLAVPPVVRHEGARASSRISARHGHHASLQGASKVFAEW